MNKMSLVELLRRWLLSVLLLSALLCGVAQSPADVILSCSESTGRTGDWSFRGFYITNYPGISLDSARLRISSATMGNFVLSLTVRSVAYDGAILGNATTAVTLNGSVTENLPVTFTFPSLHIVKGSRVCFALKMVSGTASDVYYAVGDGSCSQVIQTEDKTPPVSTFRRNGVDLEINGANGLLVTPGWTIQAAIDAASPGDTVSVAPGLYNESITLKL